MPELYKGKIPVVRRDLNAGFLRGTPADLGFGCVPRDFAVDPVEMRDSPDGIKTYSDAELRDIYDAAERDESSLEHILLRAVERGEFEFLDQASFPDCWTHSTAHAIMLDRLKQNLPYVKLNAVAVATLLNQTNGGWSGLSMKFAREHGFPVCGPGPGEWPYQSRRGKDTPELRASMKLHRDLEDWYDLGRREWDQKLARAQLAACLSDNLPCPSDYNRFGHAMLSLRWIPALNGPLTLNSWKGFGYHGLCVLADMVPDNAVALRASTPSAK
jgi:hypothetical protein